MKVKYEKPEMEVTVFGDVHTKLGWNSADYGTELTSEGDGDF